MSLHINPHFKTKKERAKIQRRNKDGIVQVIAGKSVKIFFLINFSKVIFKGILIKKKKYQKIFDELKFSYPC